MDNNFNAKICITCNAICLRAIKSGSMLPRILFGGKGKLRPEIERIPLS